MNIRLLRSVLALSAIAILALSACSTTSDVYPVADPGDNAATLRVPQKLVVLKVDEEDAKLPILLSDPYELRIAPGTHELLLQYYATIGDGQERKIATSREFAVTVNTAAGTVYVVDVEAQGNLDESIVTAPTPAVAVTAVATGESAIAQMAAVPQTPDVPAPAVPTVSSTAQAEALLSQQDPVERLKFWWKLADEKERAAFLTWMAGQ